MRLVLENKRQRVWNGKQDQFRFEQKLQTLELAVTGCKDNNREQEPKDEKEIWRDVTERVRDNGELAAPDYGGQYQVKHRKIRCPS